MIREVCLFDKFSFCKNGVKCDRVHLKEVCQTRECDYRECNKRHPRPCRIFRKNGFCRFGSSCKYSHRQSKEVEDQSKEINKQNKIIESLREITSKLSNQVADQKEEIKDLKRRLLEIETRDLLRLQKQVDGLVQTNSEKEKILKEQEEELLMEVEADKTQNAENSNEKSEESVQELEEIVFETLVTSRKKKWAMKDRTFAECIVEKYKVNMELLDWFEEDEGDGLEELIKSHFLSSAEFLEEEANERKITNKELKAAVEFFKSIVNRPDFTNQKFKQILKQGRQFIDEEMKKVMSV